MTLSKLERRWLCLVFETLLPSAAHERLGIGASDAPMDRFLVDLTRSCPAHFTVGLRACVWFLMLCPPFVIGRMSTFAGLDHGDRLRVLDALQTSRVYVVREMPLLFKTTACLGYCGLPAVQSAVGISPVDATPPDWARDTRRLPTTATSR